jgi:hypothetical protein
MNTPLLTTKLYMPPLRQELVPRPRQASAIFSLFNFAFQMLTGRFIPLQILRAALRVLGIVAFPQILGMDLLRHYLMGTQALMAIPAESLVLLIQFVGLGVLAKLAVQRLERSARDQGLHYI